MRNTSVSPERLLDLRGKRSREVIAHALRQRGHGTDAKAIWRYETGRNQPNARLLPDYAEVLGAASVEELYGSESSEDDEESDQVGAMSIDQLLLARIDYLVARRAGLQVSR